MSSNPNSHLYAIPAAYGLAIAPHVYYLTRMSFATGFQWSNVAPRENWATFKGKVPEQLYQRCLRARACHINALEGFPFFAAAMIAGTGRVPQKDLQTAAWEYIGVRALYSLAYIGIKNEAASYLRTGLWFWSLALPAWTLFKSANALEV